jgi:hypothetical protein
MDTVLIGGSGDTLSSGSVQTCLFLHPEFAREYMSAKQFQIQSLAEEMVDLADVQANDCIERKGPEGKKVPVDSKNFPRSKQQRGALGAVEA